MSEVFEIAVKTPIKIKIYGVEYSIRKPTVKDADKLSKLTDVTSDKEKLERTIDVVDTLGFPKAVAEEMEIDHFTKLVEHIFGSLKKS